ncbi:SDR family NAD(P)-dependent oxidoreductase [Sphingomonas sp. MMS12-HWE2-04]|uniref:SDR family NAD(P)-dependent oxidoreductase n=1 Tax=Sphingomonas sp. MMS12-HWE2-04 TaxID=3234199 RepID=UPI00384E0E51
MTAATAGQVVLAGYACRYPDATTPAELFANALGKRQSFRSIPESRLDLSDYRAAVIGEADSITPILAGLLTDWHFDPQKFRIPKDTFASTDLVHWLALEVADAAVAACGGIENFSRDRTGVIVANTLTGEFSRTSQLRLRWPWLDRQLARVLEDLELDAGTRQSVRGAFRDRVYSAFPTPDEESLAGGLANTVAGRITNYFDLHAGAWSVDAACASSLVAIANAAEHIASGRADAMIVVGVDLSLDPFELVGFSRAGALTSRRMRVFDKRADGFWPGEGAGAVVLGSRRWAEASNLEARIELAGWGLSSDGRGGLTRPEVSGQLRALREAYDRFGLDPSDLCFVEAHGTGTAVGDPTEIRALAQLLETDTVGRRVAVGSIKGNIGHTKAAAGLAGLIKAAEGLREGIVPPHAGCNDPHPVFAETGHRLAVAAQSEELRVGASARLAGVSSFGFGGVNVHAVLRAPSRPSSSVPAHMPWSEDELFVFAQEDEGQLREALLELQVRAQSASVAELRDLAAHYARSLAPGRIRLAFVAGRPDELCRKIDQALLALDGKDIAGIFLGRPAAAPRIGLLFPGQGAPCRITAGAWGERFGIQPHSSAPRGDPGHTSNAQPLIVGAALAGLELLRLVGVKAKVALGHSLGELPALHWAGAFDDRGILEIAAVRGAAMGEQPGGAMLLLSCGAGAAVSLIEGSDAEVACLNGAMETVVSGPHAAIETVAKRAATLGISTQGLNVSHAFHSQMMKAAGEPLRAAILAAAPSPVKGKVISTVTGDAIAPAADLAGQLVDQLVWPVRFTEAANGFARECDFAIEVGPGASMSRLIQAQAQAVPAASLDVFGTSCIPVFECLARLHAAGAVLDLAALYSADGYRAPRKMAPVLLTNPCGTFDDLPFDTAVEPQAPSAVAPGVDPAAVSGETCLDQLTSMIAEKTGLAPQSILPDHRFLDDLHLNSLAVSRILSGLAQHRGITLPGHRTAFSNASLQEVADELTSLEAQGPVAQPERVTGVARWVRRFRPGWRVPEAGPLDMFDWREVALGAPLPQDSPAIAIRIDAWDGGCDGPRLLAMVQQAVGQCRHLALIHSGAPIEGFVRSLAAEGLFETVRAIDTGGSGGAIPALPSGSAVVSISADGAIESAKLALDETVYAAGAAPELFVVTGGARGICAEVAIELAKRSGAAIVLVGRSAADTPDVTRTLARATGLGLRVGYAQANVDDFDGLQKALAEWFVRFGPPSHLVHAAGVNDPMAFMQIDEAALTRTLVPKSLGLHNAVAACGAQVRRVVTFGSIIGRLGLQGEAHYALANAEQGRVLEALAGDNPAMTPLNIEWSVWAGAGMGDRLGVIDQLSREGVDAIPLGDAIDQACDLILSDARGSIVVTSRFASADTAPNIGSLRYLDLTLAYTPGVELVCETRLNHGRDPYLLSHQVDGVPVMPGVMLLEAMAQVATQLASDAAIGAIEAVEFLAAITVGIEGRRIRVAALRREDGAIACEVRSEEDGFAAPVVQATIRCGKATLPAGRAQSRGGDPVERLYGPLFFHGAVFQRVAGITDLSSRTLVAGLAPSDEVRLFGAYEPQALVLGDPILRDCGLHLLQACVPHRRVLPVRAARIELAHGGSPIAMRARELWTRGTDYAFDIEWHDARGQVVERWHEAVFRQVGSIAIGPVLEAMPGVLRAYLERLARETTGDDSLQCSLVIDAGMERGGRRVAALGAIGIQDPNEHRGDGAPVFPEGVHCSLSHTDAATLAVRGDRPLGCDVVSIAAFAENGDAARWAAVESLRKIGAIGELQPVNGSGFRMLSGEYAMILPPLDVAGVPHLASIAFSARGQA